MRKIDVVHAAMTNPDVRIASVHQQTRFAHQARKKPALNIHQHNRKDHADQSGNQFATIKDLLAEQAGGA